jgi:DNA-binding GntR family transcriptional regulator
VANAESTGTVGASLRPIDGPRSLAEDAADRIREQILAGGFRQGDHLVESKIAQQLKISRGPVREAFKLLRAEGLVEEEPRRGTFVVRLETADVREVYEVRAAIEGRAARLLATSADPLALAELRALVDRIDDAVRAQDPARVSRADIDLHEALCRLSGNSRLLEVFLRYIPVMRALLRLDERVYSSADVIALQHRPLLEAIEAHDPDRAASLSEEHCDQAADLIVAYIDSLPDRRPRPSDGART